MQKQVAQYLLVQEIGEGQFGKVYKALDTENNNLVVAVKCIAKTKVHSVPQIWSLFQSELTIMKGLKHPNLLNLIDFKETTSNYYMVVPFCKDGDLEKLVMKRGKIPEEEAVFYLKQIMSGFVYLYQNKIMHRDFKLANVFLDGDHAIVGDFGFSKQGVEATTTKLGTPYNMAPEIMFSTGNSCYTSKADLWAIGVAYYNMLYGVQPFQANSMHELQNLVLKYSGANVRFKNDVNVSEESKNLIRGLLEFDHNRRLNWQDFFNHPLFAKFVIQSDQGWVDQKQVLDVNQLGQHVRGAGGFVSAQTINQYSGNSYTHQGYPSGGNLTPGITQNVQRHPPQGGQNSSRNISTSEQHNNQNRANYRAWVEQSFLREKHHVNTDSQFSNDFELPVPGELKNNGSINQTVQGALPVNQTTQYKPLTIQPLDIRGTFQNGGQALPSGNFIQGTSPRNISRGIPGGISSRSQETEVTDFLTHERNKYLLVLQASKQWKELIKLSYLDEKKYMICYLGYLFCKKGQILNEKLKRALETKQDAYMLGGFYEFCNSKFGEKMLQEVQGDNILIVQFLSYLEPKLDELGRTNHPGQSFTSLMVPHEQTETSFDQSSRILLEHLIRWIKEKQATVLPEIYQKFISVGVYGHYSLNVHSEFPYVKNFDWTGFFQRLENNNSSTNEQILRRYFLIPGGNHNIGGTYTHGGELKQRKF